MLTRFLDGAADFLVLPDDDLRSEILDSEGHLGGAQRQYPGHTMAPIFAAAPSSS